MSGKLVHPFNHGARVLRGVGFLRKQVVLWCSVVCLGLFSGCAVSHERNRTLQPDELASAQETLKQRFDVLYIITNRYEPIILDEIKRKNIFKNVIVSRPSMVKKRSASITLKIHRQEEKPSRRELSSLAFLLTLGIYPIHKTETLTCRAKYITAQGETNTAGDNNSETYTTYVPFLSAPAFLNYDLEATVKEEVIRQLTRAVLEELSRCQ